VVDTSCSIYCGPSVYARRPVIRYTLGLRSAVTVPRPFDRAFVDSLLTCLPGLSEHRDTCDAPGLLERGLRAGEQQSLPRLFEHLCIELQNLSGVELHCEPANAGHDIGPADALVPYEDEPVALEAGRLALGLLRSLLADPRSPVSAFPAADIQRQVEAFRQFAERQTLPVQDRAIVRAARARDIPVLRIVGRVVQLGHGRRQQRLNGSETTRTNVISSQLAANKDYARRVFRAAGLPVPPYERVYRARDAVAAARRIGFPVVVKPNNGNMGQGVSVGMKTAREVRDAYRRARQLGRSVIVEQFIPGCDYRMLVIDGELRAAAKRVPAHVVGDGVHTIEDLVREANRDPRRGAGQRNAWTRLEFDEQSDRLLAELGYRRDSVARGGEIVYLRRNANTSAGGTAVDVTDQVHPQNHDIAVRAATSIGLDVAGVDLLVHDISLPMRGQGGVICEINSRPGIRKHLWPAEGRPRDVIGPIVDMLFPPGTRSRIPIAAVTGTGNTTHTARLLAHLLSGDGTTVGLAARNGVFIDGRRMDGGGLAGPSATRMLLLDPAVEAAVVELSPADVVQNGLGYDWCDACAVINDDQIDAPGLADALRLVVDAARRAVVLSADDQRCRALQLDSDADVWYVSTNGQPPTVTTQPSVALENAVDGESISFSNGEGVTARISLACDRAWAAADDAQGARSALYAAALALCLTRRPDDVERALRTFPAGYCA